MGFFEVQTLLKQGAQERVQAAFEDLQAGRLHSLYGQPVSVLSPLHTLCLHLLQQRRQWLPLQYMIAKK